jgi:hypothetical protein
VAVYLAKTQETEVLYTGLINIKWREGQQNRSAPEAQLGHSSSTAAAFIHYVEPTSSLDNSPAINYLLTSSRSTVVGVSCLEEA